MTTSHVETDVITESLEELIAEAENAPVQADDITRGQIINRGGTDLEDLPLAVSEMKRAGRTLCYDIRTGRQFFVNNNMLLAQLEKTAPLTGQRWTTTKDPGIRPKQGQFVCWLHTQSPKAETIAHMGFPPCIKTGIPTAYDVERHVKKKHGLPVYEAINTFEQRQREERRETLNLALLERAIGPATAPTKPVQPQQAVPASDTFSQTCGACGEELFSKPNGARIKLMHHKKVCLNAHHV